jgi:hypothetical protein
MLATIPASVLKHSRALAPFDALAGFRLASLAVFAALTGPWLAAQDVPTTIAPPLTSTLATTPVTTLSDDLLSPARPFIYDETGAFVYATALDPAVNAADLSSVRAETDTEVRDSTQNGQANPYALAASRAGLSFSGTSGSRTVNSGGTGQTGAREPSGSASSNLASSNPTSAPESFAGEAPGESSTAESGDYRSSWGTSSGFGAQSFGSRAAESSWGGESSGGRSDGSSGSQADYSGDDNLASSRIPSAGTGRGQGWPRSETRTHAGTRVGALTGPAEAGRPLSTANAAAGTSAQGGGAAGSRQTGGQAKSPDNALSFALAPGREFTFGESPFSAPGGNGELTFLNPNILAATSGLGSRLTRTYQASDRQTGRDNGMGQRDDFARRGANPYGLAPRPSASVRSFKTKHNPYLDAIGGASSRP